MFNVLGWQALRGRAQVLGEMAVLLALVAAALLTIQVYVSRSLKAKYKSVVDTSGNVFGLHQYEPYYASSVTATRQQQDTHLWKSPGETGINVIENTTQKRSFQKVDNVESNADGWNW